MGWLERLETKNDTDDGFIPADAVHWGGLPRTNYDYRRDVSQGLYSNVIMSPIMWLMRTFTEARAVVQRKRNTVWENVEDHPVETLIESPNPFYDGDALWKATVLSYAMDGNGYWLPLRNAFGEPVQYWYAPHWLITPKWDRFGQSFITHYEYRPVAGGRAIDLAPRDVVHLRFGLDPENPRLGYSPLKALLREIFTDDEASNFSAQILKNMGVPGLVVAPKDALARPSPEDLEELKRYMRTGFTGDNRGDAMVMGMPTEVHQFGFDPNKLMLANLRDISEERVCAAIGIPAAVVGFGSGLQSTKVGATMRELHRAAWVQCLIPMQKSIARQLTKQILPDFVAQMRRFRVWFDTSDMSAFREEDDARSAAVVKLVAGGVLRVDRAQEMLGLEVDETQKVYLRPSGVLPVGPSAPELPAPTEPTEERGESGGEEEDDDEQKMLAAVASRVGMTSNGNGGSHG